MSVTLHPTYFCPLISLQGLHIDTIAERTKSPIDPLILGPFSQVFCPYLDLEHFPSYADRILRFLATNHFFKEVSPSVYANNRTSAVLNKAQPVESILANPLDAYDKLESAPAALATFVYVSYTVISPRSPS